MYYGSGLDDFTGLADLGVFGVMGARSNVAQQRIDTAAAARAAAAAKREADRLAAEQKRKDAAAAAAAKRSADQAAAAEKRQAAYVAKHATTTPATATGCPSGWTQDAVGNCSPPAAGAAPAGTDAGSGYATPQTLVCKFGADTSGTCYTSRAAANKATRDATAAANKAARLQTQQDRQAAAAAKKLTAVETRQLKQQATLARKNPNATFTCSDGSTVVGGTACADGSVPTFSPGGPSFASTPAQAAAQSGIDPTTGLPYAAPGLPSLQTGTCPDGSMPDPTTGMCASAVAPALMPAPLPYPLQPALAPAPGYPDYSQMAPMSMGPAAGGGGFAPMDSAPAGSPMGIDPTTGQPYGQQSGQPGQPGQQGSQGPAPAAMDITASADGGNPFGASNTTMLLVLGGAAVLWYLLSKKKGK
jgi:hypothetical protein